MKDKLRELAEWWKSAGCRNGSSHECADELLAILDAEGDGGAVGWFTDDHLSDKSATTYSKEVADRWAAKGWPVTAFYTHPARSGVVSDEDVEAVLTAAGRGDFHRADVRAALEHFAAIAQEKQS